jgi:hypothetical protein
MTDPIEAFYRVAERQGYKGAMAFQIMPVLGPVSSLPVGIVSGIHAIVELARAIFEDLQIKCKEACCPEGAFIFRERGNMHWRNAGDLAVIFIEHVANFFTLGVVGHAITWNSLESLINFD